MFNWFKRKPKASTVPDAPYDLESQSEREYRETRIREIAEIWGQSLEYTAERLDKWVIREIEMTTWPDGLKEEGVMLPQLVPTPLWDDEWMLTRENFPTYEQAEAHVNRVGGTLLSEG